MSEKKRQKKDGQDKNKDNQRMREANNSAQKKNAASPGKANRRAVRAKPDRFLVTKVERHLR